MEDSSDEENVLDNNVPNSPTDGATAKTSTNNNNNNLVPQKVPANSKTVYKIGQPLLTTLPQPKVAQFVSNNDANVSHENGKESSSGGSKHTHQKSPKKRSRSRSLTPPRKKKNLSPKKRSRYIINVNY